MVTQYAMESGPLSPGSTTLNQNGGGGEAGIWMSGMGLSTDGNRLFAVTGNGAAHQNIGTPNSGSTLLRTLGEAAIDFAVNPGTGAVSLSDWFQPYDYQVCFVRLLFSCSYGVELLHCVWRTRFPNS